jgi:hypothetical protein
MGWRDAQSGRLTSQPPHDTASGTDSGAGPLTGSQGSSSLGAAGGTGPLALGLPSSYGAEEFQFDHELTPVKSRPRVARRIFAVTYNMGGSGGVLDPKQVAAWIPLDYDLYAIGLQECESVAEVVAAVQRRLGACVNKGRGGGGKRGLWSVDGNGLIFGFV